MINCASVLRRSLVNLLDWSFFRLNRTAEIPLIRHIVIINWNGKYGDAIVSAPLIEFLTCNSDIKVSVITTKSLENLYSSVMKVDTVYLLDSVSWKNVLQLCLKVKSCDAVIPPFGKLGIIDVLCAFLLNPKLVFSTDDSLRISCTEFVKESENKDVYKLYELIAGIIAGEHITLTKADLCHELVGKPTSYNYLINPFGSREDKSLTIDRTQSLIRHLVSLHRDSIFGILYSPDSLSTASKLVQTLGLPNVKLVSGVSTFEKVIPIICSSEILISVDTSLIHVARVLNKSTVAIYPETKYFNIWQPVTTSRFQVVKSSGLIDFWDVKDMNRFENLDVDYALNRISNAQRLENKKVVFLYWHSSEEDIPIGHALNIKNIKSRLMGSDWDVVVTTLDKRSKDYIENYISLPLYFTQLVEKTGDEKIMHGNQSDIIRLRLLEAYGGVYLDTSTIFLKDDFEEVPLYKKLIESPYASLAGYTNVTFTRKNEDGSNYFDESKDGMELSLLYAKKNANILQVFNREIDKYWNWKTHDKDYRDNPPFKEYGLGKISFLNEYHIHYSIYHLIITKQPELLKEIVVQSMHMRGKETALSHGPYAISDLFCRGNTSYQPALPNKMLQCFIEGEVEMWDGSYTSLKERIGICQDMDLLKIPAYLRKELEREFTHLDDFLNKKSLYYEFYRFFSSKYRENSTKRNTKQTNSS